MVEVQTQQSWDDAVEQLARDAEAAAESGADLAARLDLASRWFGLCWLACAPSWVARSCRASMALYEPVLAEPEVLTDQIVATRLARAAGLKHLEQLQEPVSLSPVIPADLEPEAPEPSDEVERARLARRERINRRPAPAPAKDLQPTLERPTPALEPAPATEPAKPRKRRKRRPPEPPPEGWLYGEEAAELLGLLNRNSVASLASKGQLPPEAHRKLGGRAIYNFDVLVTYADRINPAGWLKTCAAAAELGITAAKLHNLRATGKIPPNLWRLPTPKRVVFNMAELRQWYDSQREPELPEWAT
jgi:hypothetical protein